MRIACHRSFAQAFILGLTTSLLASCGGGGGTDLGGGASDGDGTSGGGSGAGFAGVYVGTNLLRCDVQAMLALVTEEGRIADFHSVGAEMDYGVGLAEVGAISGSGPTYSASVTEYRGEGPTFLTQAAVDPGDASVEIVSVSNGGFVVRWPDRQQDFCTETQVTLTPSRSLYVRPASLEKLAGVYSGNIPGYAIALSVDSNGQLSGSDGQGCVISGSVTVPHPDRNYYGIAATVESCLSDGDYAGEALLADGMNGGQDNLLLLDLVHAGKGLAINLALSR